MTTNRRADPPPDVEPPAEDRALSVTELVTVLSRPNLAPETCPCCSSQQPPLALWNLAAAVTGRERHR